MNVLDRAYRTVVQANALKHSRGEVLADFEADTIEEVWGRLRRDPQAVVSTAEMTVLEDALAAMHAAPSPYHPALERAA